MTALVDTSVLIDYLRGNHQAATRGLLSVLVWHPVHAEGAGALGRQWLPSQHTIYSADLAIAATAIRTGSRLLTRNVRHFPMFPSSKRPTELVPTPKHLTVRPPAAVGHPHRIGLIAAARDRRRDSRRRTLQPDISNGRRAVSN